MKKLVTGLLAHVDAGKTTLSEALLFNAGSIGKMGRVDHKDAFLDTDSLERERGITIFSKQAVLNLPNTYMTLLDTPGHVDFASEAERTLSVLDYAVLVISGSDMVQGHTETLWRLLRSYNIPTFIFVNKMDLPGADKAVVLSELQKKLSHKCVDMSLPDEEKFEALSLCSESLLERYLEEGLLKKQDISDGISKSDIFPVYFGSALKSEGVGELLKALDELTLPKKYPDTFGASVFKIGRDKDLSRLTFMKITGGSLKVKDLISGIKDDEEWKEKADQIRIYSGEKFKSIDEADAGTVCAVKGLSKTFVGEGLGCQEYSRPPILSPVLTYKIILPESANILEALKNFRLLEEEDPMLHIIWKEAFKEIHVEVMGEVQLEVLKRKIEERFKLNVSFGKGRVVYKETIASSCEGVGHFEPLRHYAEVHLLLEPGARGSGLTFSSLLSTDILDLNWQRLILTHLDEKQHAGVLTGSPITDIHISLINGRAHPKHTEGGDFRQATYRAVRQGLRRANSIILEPYYDFTLEVPIENAGRAMTDIERMGGSFSSPEQTGNVSILKGSAPVSKMQSYNSILASYSKGRGRLSLMTGRYEICQNPQEVMAEIGYDADTDLENTADSVFCAHGAGFIVPWFEVENYMHLPSGIGKKEEITEEVIKEPVRVSRSSYGGSFEDDEELKAIFERTYGEIKRKNFNERKQDVIFLEEEKERKKKQPDRRNLPEYLLVDGYNIIFAWDELKEIAKDNLEAARQALADILSNYQGYRKCNIILVFDAYKVKGNPGSVQKYHNISIVFTKEAETADSYIEKTTYEICKDYRVRVATSDGMEQMIILGHGAERISARIFKAEIMDADEEISGIVKDYTLKNKKTRVIETAIKNAENKT